MVSRYSAPIHHLVLLPVTAIFVSTNQMTENKLRKFISKPREPPSGKRTHQPIILTDSKGNYLKKYACHDVEKQIVWLPKSGAKIEDSTQWLKSNISKKIINYGDIWLYVWMGTCNLT